MLKLYILLVLILIHQNNAVSSNTSNPAATFGNMLTKGIDLVKHMLSEKTNITEQIIEDEQKIKNLKKQGYNNVQNAMNDMTNSVKEIPIHKNQTNRRTIQNNKNNQYNHQSKAYTNNNSRNQYGQSKAYTNNNSRNQYGRSNTYTTMNQNRSKGSSNHFANQQQGWQNSNYQKAKQVDIPKNQSQSSQLRTIVRKS